MTGSTSESGVVRLAVQDIFHRIRTQQTSNDTNSQQQREYLVRVSYLEIYNERKLVGSFSLLLHCSYLDVHKPYTTLLPLL